MRKRQNFHGKCTENVRKYRKICGKCEENVRKSRKIPYCQVLHTHERIIGNVDRDPIVIWRPANDRTFAIPTLYGLLWQRRSTNQFERPVTSNSGPGGGGSDWGAGPVAPTPTNTGRRCRTAVRWRCGGMVAHTVLLQGASPLPRVRLHGVHVAARSARIFPCPYAVVVGSRWPVAAHR